MAARLRRGIAWYDGHLKAAPIRTKIATSVSILSVADVIRQGLEWRNRPAPAAPSPAASPPPSPGAATPQQQPRELPAEAQQPWEWDSARTGRMSLWGCTGHPLVIHYWMNMMERWHGSLPITAPKAQIIKLAARKVTVDQFTARCISPPPHPPPPTRALGHFAPPHLWRAVGVQPCVPWGVPVLDDDAGGQRDRGLP